MFDDACPSKRLVHLDEGFLLPKEPCGRSYMSTVTVDSFELSSIPRIAGPFYERTQGSCSTSMRGKSSGWYLPGRYQVVSTIEMGCMT